MKAFCFAPFFSVPSYHGDGGVWVYKRNVTILQFHLQMSNTTISFINTSNEWSWFSDSAQKVLNLWPKIICCQIIYRSKLCDNSKIDKAARHFSICINCIVKTKLTMNFFLLINNCESCLDVDKFCMRFDAISRRTAGMLDNGSGRR